MSETPRTEGRSPGENTETDDPDIDTILEVIRNERRRAVLEYIKGREEATIREISEHLAELEADEGTSNTTPRKRAYISLYQSHLPRMAELKAISYDRDRGIICPNNQTDEFNTVLDACKTATSPNEPKWHFRYLVLSMMSLVLLVLATLETVWLAEVAFPAVVLSIGGLSVYHTIKEKR